MTDYGTQFKDSKCMPLYRVARYFSFYSFQLDYKMILSKKLQLLFFLDHNLPSI